MQILDPKETGEIPYANLVNMINDNDYWPKFFTEQEKKKEEEMKSTKKVSFY